jgi:parvulin-like peptidyl-prolyl isomerase
MQLKIREYEARLWRTPSRVSRRDSSRRPAFGKWGLTLCFVLTLHAEILDRIAVVVGRTVITEAQLDEELRVTAFLNHEAIKRDRDSRKAAADRLIEQELVRREMQLTQYASPSETDVDRLFAEVEKQHGGEETTARTLAEYELTEPILKQHLRFQLTTLRFIDFRFRPDIEISEQDIHEYYNREVEKWRQSHTGTPPSFEESRDAIDRSVSNERLQDALSSWLKETRASANITYLDKELQ